MIAGPGAIATAVSISTSNEEGMLAALIGALMVSVLAFISFRWLGGLLAKLSPRTTSLMLRIGGLLLATIGVQMVLLGLKKFFAE